MARIHLLELGCAIACGTGAAPFLYDDWIYAVRLEGYTRGIDVETHFFEMFFPGVHAAVQRLAAHDGAIWTMPRDQDPGTYQRILEMIYPLRPRPYDAATLQRGDLVVLAAGRELAVPADEVFARGLVRVLQVR
jgi:hypothetical protein